MSYNDDKMDVVCGAIFWFFGLIFLFSLELAWYWYVFWLSSPYIVYKFITFLIPELLDIIVNSSKIDNILKYSDDLDIEALKRIHRSNKTRQEKLPRSVLDEAEIYIDIEKNNYRKEELRVFQIFNMN
jgi:hypothetical protein